MIRNVTLLTRVYETTLQQRLLWCTQEGRVGKMYVGWDACVDLPNFSIKGVVGCKVTSASIAPGL